MKDLTGREIEKGKIVAHATRVANSGHLTIGVVKEVRANFIKVQKVDSSWDDEELTLYSKLSKIEDTSRVVILDTASLPTEWHRMFLTIQEFGK